MLFDLKKPLDVERLKARINYCERRGEVVELKVKKPPRSPSQNRYLHLILGWFACETGNTLEFVKEAYFKEYVNPNLFVVCKEDEITGTRICTLRSTTELNTAEMTTAIERFRNWSAMEGGIYLPSPDEENMIRDIEVEISRQERYL